MMLQNIFSNRCHSLFKGKKTQFCKNEGWGEYILTNIYILNKLMRFTFVTNSIILYTFYILKYHSDFFNLVNL